MDELGGALKELARQVQAPTPVDPAALWAQGRVRARRRRIALAATAIAVAVLGSLAVTRPEPRVVMPAGSPHAPAVPENIYEPDRFLAGVSGEGPPGRLAVIAPTSGDEDHYFGMWFGISATTGAYRRLDLPGLATDSPMRLSPDGTRIAYWVTGPTRRKDFGPRTNSSAGGPLPARPVAGVAVYDALDGSVVRQLIPSDYGLRVEDATSLSWLGDRDLVFGYAAATGTNSAKGGGAHLWTPGVSSPRPIAGDPFAEARYVPAFPPTRYVKMNDATAPYVVVDRQARPTGTVLRTREGDGVPDAVSFSPRWVVKLGVTDTPAISRVFVGNPPRDGAVVDLTPVGKIVFPHFLGWQSASRLLVSAVPAKERDGTLEMIQEGPGADVRALYSVDLDAKTVHRLGRIDFDLDHTRVQVADSLLGDPMVPGRRPPSLFDVFRMPLAVGLGVLLAGATAWLVVRRRHRA